MNTVRALIFGGTSEGRELSEFASAHQVPVLVSVVSEYGESLLKEDAYVRVHQGALDEAAMEELLLFEAPEIVLDATHPYARVVSGQVGVLCEQLQIPYRRVVRETVKKQEKAPDLFFVPSPEAAAKLLAEDGCPVLLTTGSKELEIFARAEHLKDRLFVRVLPDRGVLAKCEGLGISGSRVIAMQGPFSEEMNRAILRHTGAKWMVTKESGSRGGFSEKVKAARDCGCRIIVIERPVKENGITLSEAKKLLLERGISGGEPEVKRRSISLIGMGMGGGRQLTLEAAEALKECDAVLGAPRMLEDVEPWCAGAKKEALYLADQIADWLENHPGYKHVGVVYSGDTGFYSGCSSLTEELRKRGAREDLQWMTVRVYPGISSVSSLCARMQVPWEGIYLASAHGRDCDVAGLLKRYDRLFLLLGGREDLGSICRKLASAGYGQVSVTAGIRMGYPDEKLVTGTAEELSGVTADGLAAVVLERTTEDRKKTGG